MDLDGLNFEDYIGDAIDIYRHDFPDKAILFDDLAEQNIQIENNEIQRVGGRMSGLSPMDQYHVMKYLQLKYLTLYLQKNKFMGKFCFYGCWCFPRAAGAQWSGYGVPVDNIDKSCREFTTCYNCIFNQQLIGQRCNESNPVRYNIGGSQNAETGEITIFCKDPQGTCERSRCECDKDLALKLQKYESEWSIQNHHHWGQPQFDPKVTCSYNVNEFLKEDPEQQQTLTYAVVSQINPQALVETNVPADPTKLKLDGINSQDSGARPDMTLYKPRSLPTYGPIIGCCGRAPHVHFFRKGQRCCKDGEIVDERFPCSMDFE